MTVEELITKLQAIKNKDKEVVLATYAPDNEINNEGLGEVKIKDGILHLIGDYLTVRLQDGKIEL